MPGWYWIKQNVKQDIGIRTVLVVLVLCCFKALPAQDSALLQYHQHKGLDQLNLRPDSAAVAFRMAARLAQEQNNLAELGLSLNRLGLALKNQGKIEEAMASFRNSLVVRQQLNDSTGVASVFNNMGTVFKMSNQLDSALYYALACLHYREKIGLQKKLSRSYLNIGNLYNLMQDTANAMVNYAKAERLARAQEDEHGLALAMYNSANLLSNHGEFEKAAKRFEESLYLQQKLDNPQAMARIYNGKGVLLEMQGKPTQAETNYRLALTLLDKLHLPEDLAAVYLNLSNVLMQQNKLEDAFEALEKGVEIAHNANLYKTEADFYFNIYKYYAATEQWQAALTSFQKHVARNDSLNSEATKRAFIEIKEKYESEQKQRLIDKQRASLEQKTVENKVLLSGCLLLLVLGLLGFVIYRQQARNRSLLAERKVVQNQQHITNLLMEKEVETMEAMLNGQHLERQRIARDLHDQLGGIMATVKLHFNSMVDAILLLPINNQQSFEKANQILDLACNEVRIIAHDMASGMLVQFGLIGALQELVQAVEKKVGLDVQLHVSQWDGQLDDGLELDLYRTIQELISNVLRYAQATELNVLLTRTPDSLNVLVEDNGVGFEYNPNKPINGMGLKNIANRIYKYNGTFAIDSMPSRGTTVVIDIPIAD